MSELLPPLTTRIPLGIAKILKVFKKDGNKQIVGGRVEQGMITADALAEIRRGRDVAGIGTIQELQQNKNKVDRVEKGLEFGILFNSSVLVQTGDVLDIYKEEITKQTL